MSHADFPSAPLDLALRLPNTQKGKEWLSQFDLLDRENAARLLGALTLVSHSAFERALQSLVLSEAEKVNGPVALYAVREIDKGVSYFEAMANPDDPLASLDAVARGSDLGSEARIAAIIRNICKTKPEKLLNHPSLEKLRTTRAKAIIVVDDIIGSGKRSAGFISAMWRSKSVMSWYSRHEIQFVALAYTATQFGAEQVCKLGCCPKVVLVRDCPTFNDIPWHNDIESAIVALCKNYGQRTSRPRMKLGFKKTMAALVFEHGCPNNTPSILWAPISEKSTWQPMFPDRTVPLEQTSAFPPDVMARDRIAMLTELSGDEEAELPTAILGESALGMTTVTVLALVASGIRSRAALSYATGYDAKDCTELLNRCVERGYLTGTLRLTPAGRAELNEQIRPSERSKWVPQRGEDDYYPKQLRGPP
ncbi:phosphoribosyltransferase-like protein [Acetobacter pasteurianus]